MFRDMLLRYGALNPLLQTVYNSNKPLLIKDAAWAISNLTQRRPQSEINLVKEAVPVLCAILMKESDEEVLADAIWPLCHLSERDEDSVIDSIIAAGLIPYLIRYLR